MPEPAIEPVNPPVEEVPPATPPAPLPLDSDPAFKRMKDDVAKQRARAQELEDENKRLKEEKLKAAKNWEEIAKLREQEAEAEKAKRLGLEKAVIDERKFSALKTEALKAGIHPDSVTDLDMLDFPEIDVETTQNGKIIVHGAENAIASLKLKRPHWFNKKPASVNPMSPESIQGTPVVMTTTQALVLEREYKKNPTKENKAKYEAAVKALK